MEKVKAARPWMMGIFLIPIIFLLGFYTSSYGSTSEYNKLLDSYESQHEEIVVERNKSVSLEHSLRTLGDDNTDLLSLVAELKARPAEIRTIVRTKTILVPGTPTVITPDLPEEFLYTIGADIVTGRFAQEDDQYRFDTYELSFKSTLVITDSKTASLLQVSSSYDPDVYHDVESELIVQNMKTTKFFEPHIGMGVTASLPMPTLTASLYVTLLHPKPQLDLLGIRVSANSEALKVGIDPVGYNVGHDLPILTDLWITPGVSLNITGGINGDLTIGSKF